jgi:hypothetical protein
VADCEQVSAASAKLGVMIGKHLCNARNAALSDLPAFQLPVVVSPAVGDQIIGLDVLSRHLPALRILH